MWRKASWIMFIMLFAGLIVFAFKFHVEPIKAWTGTVYILADGSIDPSDAPINRDGNIYTLTDDIFDSSIIVECNNIVLNGVGHFLNGSNNNIYGIRLARGKNVTITNFTISGFMYGIILDSSSYNSIVNNTLIASKCYGVFLSQSNYNYLVNNTIMNGAFEAIKLESSNCNMLIGNNVVNNFIGISLTFCTNNTLRENKLKANKYNFNVGGLFLSNYIHDVDTSNTVDGKPIVYWINRFNETVPLNAGCVVVVNSSMITVRDLKLTNNFYGVTFAFTENSLIKNVEISESCVGIYLESSDSNVIMQNNITEINGPGILLDRADYNTISYNHVFNTNSCGIWLEDTYGNKVIGNYVEYSKPGCPQEYDGAGILVDDSIRCQVIQNSLIRNKYGIVVGASSARSNSIIGNNIIMNDIGLVVSWSKNNIIYHNNFIENAKQVHTEFGSINKYDNDYPFGGNYWSDYNGTDLYKGSNQDQHGSDGIGDTPYVIDDINNDRYPLMGMFSSFNTSVGYSIDVVSNSTIIYFEYFESNRTVVMHVSSMVANQKFGFCKLTIPHKLLSPPYTVIINGSPFEYDVIFESEDLSVIYFSYEHSTLKIVIVPEYLSIVILLSVMSISISVVVIRKRFPT